MLRFEKAAVPKTRAHKVYQSLGGSDKTCENPDVNFPQQLAEGAGAGRSQAFLLTRRVHPKRSASRGPPGSWVTLPSEYQVEGEERCAQQQAVPLLQRRKRCQVSKVYLHTHHTEPVYKAESGPGTEACPPWKTLQK